MTRTTLPAQHRHASQHTHPTQTATSSFLIGTPNCVPWRKPFARLPVWSLLKPALSRLCKHVHNAIPWCTKCDKLVIKTDKPIIVLSLLTYSQIVLVWQLSPSNVKPQMMPCCHTDAHWWVQGGGAIRLCSAPIEIAIQMHYLAVILFPEWFIVYWARR